VGLAICFGGYRWFLILLPIWGFFFGFALGAETMQAVFSEAFLATVTSWVLGFIVGAIFALLSYVFYIFGVAILAGSLGYALGVGFMNLIGVDFDVLAWVVGIVLGVAVIILTFYFNIQKYVIIAATAIGGAGIIVGTLMFGYAGLTLAKFVDNPIQVALDDRPLWTIFFLLLAAAGIFWQVVTTQAVIIEPYENRI
jgi:hypothetical protein